MTYDEVIEQATDEDGTLDAGKALEIMAAHPLNTSPQVMLFALQEHVAAAFMMLTPIVMAAAQAFGAVEDAEQETADFLTALAFDRASKLWTKAEMFEAMERRQQLGVAPSGLVVP